MPDTSPDTSRSRAKADRRDSLLVAAARLFAQRGFGRVSLEDLGAAVGISGPAVYRHFDGKQAVLGALLVGVSDGLLGGGREVVSASAAPAEALGRLIRFHVDFAVGQADVIRVQDRDLDSSTEADRLAVRSLQRQYVELWVEALRALHPDRDDATLRMRAQAVFGLINSTPHSASRSIPRSTMREELERMAAAALA